mgnify:CR=1 FL=1
MLIAILLHDHYEFTIQGNNTYQDLFNNIHTMGFELYITLGDAASRDHALYSVNAKAYLVTVQKASNTNIDLRAEDDAVDEAVEMIVKELNPLMYLVTNSNAGTIHVVMDERSNAADMQQRIRNLGTAVGPNDIDVTGSDVAAASAIAVS